MWDPREVSYKEAVQKCKDVGQDWRLIEFQTEQDKNDVSLLRNCICFYPFINLVPTYYRYLHGLVVEPSGLTSTIGIWYTKMVIKILATIIGLD